MPDISKKRLEFATQAFLGEMRKQAMIAGRPDVAASILTYPPDQRSALMGAVMKAIKAADPAADAIYAAWFEKQASSEPQSQ